jgi:hypothetical protein
LSQEAGQAPEVRQKVLLAGHGIFAEARGSISWLLIFCNFFLDEKARKREAASLKKDYAKLQDQGH